MLATDQACAPPHRKCAVCAVCALHARGVRNTVRASRAPHVRHTCATHALCMRPTRAHRVSLLLSAVVTLMILCFAGTLLGTGLPPGLLEGLVPRIPDGAAEVALALMGTTAIPVNLLMGSSIARDATLDSMRRGVGFASLLSGIISTLVLLVGAHVPPHPPCVPFELRDVALILHGVMGDAGLVGFAIGLFGAGISSALTVPLGTVLTLEDLYELQPHPPPPAAHHAHHPRPPDSPGVPGAQPLPSPSTPQARTPQARTPPTTPPPSPPSDGVCPSPEAASAKGAPGASSGDADAAAGHACVASDPTTPGAVGGARTGLARGALPPPAPRAAARIWRRYGRLLFIGIFLALSLIPSLLRLPTISIITTAQVRANAGWKHTRWVGGGGGWERVARGEWAGLGVGTGWDGEGTECAHPRATSEAATDCRCATHSPILCGRTPHVTLRRW